MNEMGKTIVSRFGLLPPNGIQTFLREPSIDRTSSEAPKSLSFESKMISRHFLLHFKLIFSKGLKICPHIFGSLVVINTDVYFLVCCEYGETINSK